MFVSWQVVILKKYKNKKKTCKTKEKFNSQNYNFLVSNVTFSKSQK